nr:tail fiber protein [Caudoviricetes sp.]
MSKLNVGNDSSDNNMSTQATNASTQATNASTNQYLKVNYNNSIKDLLVPTKDTLDQLKESGVVYSAKKLETGTNLNTNLSKTDPFNFDGSTETGTLGVTGTLPIEHGGTGATSRTEALTALQARGSGATDANIVASGTYVLTTDTASNLPPESGYYLLVVFRYHTSDLACGQIAISLSYGNLYSRDYVGGNWKDWVCCSSQKIDTILIPNGADLNNYRNKGFYASNRDDNSIVNVPGDLGSGAFELVVTGIDADGLYCTQWLKSHVKNKIWVRTQVSSKKPWVWNGADLNNYRNKGFYASNRDDNSIVNVPGDLGSGAFELVVTGIDADGLYCTQWLKSHVKNKIWVRTQVSSKKPWVWKDWEQVIMSNTPVLTPNGIELGQLLPSTVGHGGYIDFHYQGSTNDYTSRLIENGKGVIRDEGSFVTTGYLQTFGGFWISGRGFFVNSDVYGTSLPAAKTAGRVFFKKV